MGARDFAKKAAPALSRAVPSRAARAAGLYLDVLQGRGSGTGWDMAGEAAADAAALAGVAAPVIVDGGGNYGQWVLAMHAHLQDGSASYYIIEPSTACQATLQAAALPNKVLIRCALGAEAGEGTLSGAEPGFGAASLYERHDTYFGDMSAHSELVEVRTLDSLIAEFGLERVDLLKLDVEGAEYAALQGAKRSLDAGVIRAIGFEFGSANIYSRTFFRDFWELLIGRGFAFSRILPGGRLLPVESYSEELEHFRGVSNYLARR